MPYVERKDLDNTAAIITVTLTREDLKPKIDAELKKFRNRAAIKGFRQGQAPMEYIKRMFGTSIFGDILNKMLSDELYEYLRESKLNVLGQPLPVEDQPRYSFKVDNPEKEYAISYEIGFVPEFDIQGLDKSQSFDRLTISNLDQLAEEDLEYARKRMGKRSNPEEDIQEKDILRVHARELDGDQIKEDGWETTMTVYVDNITDEALKNEFLTKKKDDTIRFNYRLLENHKEDHLYRKYLLNLPEDDDRPVGDWFEGRIEEVSRVDIADLDEEFFTNYFGGNANNREEALNELKKGIGHFYEVRSNAMLMRDFQTRLMELNRFDLPDHFLKRWLASNNEGLTAEQIETEYPAFAENLRWSILRDRLKDQFDIEVTDEELRREYANKVRQYFQAALPDHIINSSVDRLMQDEKDVEKTRKDLETDKVFQAIRELVTLNDTPVSSEVFHQTLDAITKKVEQVAD